MASSPASAFNSSRPVNTYPIPVAAAVRSAILASSDLSFRQRVRETLSGLRWQVARATSLAVTTRTAKQPGEGLAI